MRAMMTGVANKFKGGVAPITTFAANTANLNGTNQYFDAGTSLVYGDFDFFVTARVKYTAIPVNNSEDHDLMSNQNGITNDLWRLRTRWEGGVVALDFLTAENSYTTINSIRSTVALSNDIWYTVIAGYSATSGNLFITVDEEAIATAVKTFAFVNSNYNTLIGSVSTGGGSFIDGAIAFSGVARGTPSASEITELSETNAICYADLSTDLKAKFADNGAFYELANWTDHTGQELTDQTGNGVTLTNVNSTPFTGSGLTVECTS